MVPARPLTHDLFRDVLEAMDVQLKTVNITERHNIQLRMDAFNALNHATFYVGDQNINSNTFGVISSSFFGSRVVEFGLLYKF